MSIIDMQIGIKDNTIYYSNTDTCSNVLLRGTGSVLNDNSDYLPRITPLISLNAKDSAFSNAIIKFPDDPQIINTPKTAFIQDKYFSNHYKDTIYRVFVKETRFEETGFKKIEFGETSTIGIVLGKSIGLLGYYAIYSSESEPHLKEYDRRRVIYIMQSKGEILDKDIDTTIYKVDYRKDLRWL